MFIFVHRTVKEIERWENDALKTEDQKKLREDAACIIKACTPDLSKKNNVTAEINAARFVFLWRFIAAMKITCSIEGDNYKDLFNNAIQEFVEEKLYIEINTHIKDYAQYIV